MKDEEKKCLYCGEILTRKRNKEGKLEKLSDFKKRSYCNRVCSGKASQKKSETKSDEQISAAVDDMHSGDETRYKTGVEILREIANNSKDETTRLNAAKALAPYESKKANEKPSKGEERKKAAEKASTGKFQAGRAPAKVQRVK